MKKITYVLVFMFLSLNLFAKENIVVYTYHNHPPFILDETKGLTFDVVNHLNENSDDYNFVLKVVPRSRLNYVLKPWINKKCKNVSKRCASNWLVLWVNHKWGFGADSLENFSWTPLFNDSNVIISSNVNKVEYITPKSLLGMSLAGMSGHKYVGIDDLVNEGKIKRINGNSELENLFVVLSNRVDVTLLPKIAFNYYKKTNSEFEALHESKKAHQKYMRNIMTNNKDKKLISYLNSLSFEEVLK